MKSPGYNARKNNPSSVPLFSPNFLPDLPFFSALGILPMRKTFLFEGAICTPYFHSRAKDDHNFVHKSPHTHTRKQCRSEQLENNTNNQGEGRNT